MATLVGALFICLSPPAEHHRTADRFRAMITVSPSAPVVPAYTCPYDRGACGLLPVTGPAVLTVPPPDSPIAAAEQPARLDRPVDGARPPHSDSQPRAPDLHVLQVLRT
ncbi:hypothetical protein [Streptomyces sp. NPDC020965]|uniref:hypothetical protein n=1 Tax=Streptomyces sp. NPDC020965 TaxID=3365105 RepID=UPI0037AB6723